MHMQGKPETMQDAPYYNNLIEDIKSFFEERYVMQPNLGFKKTELF